MYYDEVVSEVEKGGYFDRDEQYQQTLVDDITDNLERLSDRGSWEHLFEQGYKLIRNLGRPALNDICDKLGINYESERGLYDVSSLRSRIIDFYGIGTKTIRGYVVRKDK